MHGLELPERDTLRDVNIALRPFARTDGLFYVRGALRVKDTGAFSVHNSRTLRSDAEYGGIMSSG